MIANLEAQVEAAGAQVTDAVNEAERALASVERELADCKAKGVTQVRFFFRVCLFVDCRVLVWSLVV